MYNIIQKTFSSCAIICPFTLSLSVKSTDKPVSGIETTPVILSRYIFSKAIHMLIFTGFQYVCVIFCSQRGSDLSNHILFFQISLNSVAMAYCGNPMYANSSPLWSLTKDSPIAFSESDTPKKALSCSLPEAYWAINGLVVKSTTRWRPSVNDTQNPRLKCHFDYNNNVLRSIPVFPTDSSCWSSLNSGGMMNSPCPSCSSRW